MTEDVDRNKVFQTTRVRTPLKNDVSWIQIGKQKNKQEANERTDVVVTRPVLVKQNSYVLSTAKRFEPQLPSEKPIQNGEAQPETTAESKEEHADSTVDKSNAEQNQVTAGVSVDVHVEDCIQNGEAQAGCSTKEKEAVSSVEPVEQPVADTTAECARAAVDQSNEKHNEDKVSADAHVVHPLEEPSAVAGMEESKDSAEVPVVLAVKVELQEEPSTETEVDAAVESAIEPAGEHYGKPPPEQAVEEITEAVAVAVIESSSDKSVVINAMPVEEAALQDGVEPVPDLVAEVLAQPAAEPTADGKCEKGPPGQTVEETAVAGVNIESLPETPAVTEAAGEQVALRDRVETAPDSVADTVSDLPPAVETTVKSVECRVESAASAEPVLQSRVEKVIECEVQPADNTTVEQSVERTPKSAADCVVELSLEDADKPAPASDDKPDDNRTIELTDALDVEPPTDPAPEPLRDPEQSHTEETNLKQQSDHTYTSETFQKPQEEQSSTTVKENRDRDIVCSFCDKVMDGNIRIFFSEPLVNCHPDCLKCGLCAMALGDLLTPMFLRNQVIQCDGCFAKALKT